MDAHHVETTIERDGELTLNGLPFHAGDTVEVIVLARNTESNGQKRYPLRGQPVEYHEPDVPVAPDDWEVLK